MRFKTLGTFKRILVISPLGCFPKFSPALSPCNGSEQPQKALSLLHGDKHHGYSRTCWAGLSWHFGDFLLLSGHANLKMLLFLMETKQTATGLLPRAQPSRSMFRQECGSFQEGHRPTLAQRQLWPGPTWLWVCSPESMSRPRGVSSRAWLTRRPQNRNGVFLPMGHQRGVLCSPLPPLVAAWERGNAWPRGMQEGSEPSLAVASTKAAIT